MKIELKGVWRDDSLLEDIRSEIKTQALKGWSPWTISLPPELLWPMINEVSQGMYMQWNPMLDGVGIDIGGQKEVTIRFVLKRMETSPVMTRSMRYIPSKDDFINKDLEIHNGSAV